MLRTRRRFLASLAAALAFPLEAAARAAGLSISVPPSPLSGTVAVVVSPQPPRHLLRVELYVDSASLGSRSSYPATFSWDTRTVADGTRTLRAVAVYRNRTQSETVSVVVRNEAPPPPPSPVYPSPSLYPSETAP